MVALVAGPAEPVARYVGIRVLLLPGESRGGQLDGAQVQRGLRAVVPHRVAEYTKPGDRQEERGIFRGRGRSLRLLFYDGLLFDYGLWGLLDGRSNDPLQRFVLLLRATQEEVRFEAAQDQRRQQHE